MDAQFEGLRMDSVSEELYDFLCQACTGDALCCIRAVDDTRGLTACQRIYKKYKPKTMARAIHLVAAVAHMPKVKELKHLEAVLDKWEEHGKVFTKDSGEVFSDTVPVGIVTAMLPESVQEFVYASVGIAVEHDTILAKIRALVSNEVAMADGPTPVDVDRVNVDYTKVPMKHSDDDQEIDVVNMSIQRHGCGGWGVHYKSKCPTAWP